VISRFSLLLGMVVDIDNIKELDLQLVKRRPEALPETLTLYEFLRRSREKTHQKGKGRQ
jgi:hypothetical protein